MMSVFLSISIVWVVVDLIRKKETYFPAINRKVSPMFIVVIILFVIVNWIWNIYKDI